MPDPLRTWPNCLPHPSNKSTLARSARSAPCTRRTAASTIACQTGPTTRWNCAAPALRECCRCRSACWWLSAGTARSVRCWRRCGVPSAGTSRRRCISSPGSTARSAAAWARAGRWSWCQLLGSVPPLLEPRRGGWCSRAPLPRSQTPPGPPQRGTKRASIGYRTGRSWRHGRKCLVWVLTVAALSPHG